MLSENVRVVKEKKYFTDANKINKRNIAFKKFFEKNFCRSNRKKT